MFILHYRKPLLIVLFNLVFSVFSFGANRYWIAAAPGNWNSTANWSATSGGAGGASVPVAADVAIFDANGLGNCTMNVAVSVLGIQINAGYTGTINHGANTLTVGTTGFTLASGVFNSTASSFTVGGNFTQTGGTFNHTGGTVILSRNATSQINVPVSITFNNLNITGTGVSTVYNCNSDTLKVNGVLTFSGANKFTVTNGILVAKGNINVTNTSTTQNLHTGTILLINGTGNQTLSGSHASNIQAYLPTVQIKKNSGTLFFSNKICVEGNWIYTSGTLDYTTNTNTICFVYGKNFTGNSHSLGDVEFNTPGATNSAFNLGSIVLTVTGTLTLSGGTGQLTLQNSTINAQGDITITHTRTTTNSATTLININGSSNQTITGTLTANQGRLPAVTINKSSGTLFLANNVTIEGNYTYTAGTIDYSTNTNNVCFYGVGSTLTLAGSHSLGSVEFVGAVGNVYSLSGGMTLNVFGTLTFSGSSQFRLTGGTIASKGNISLTNTYNATNTHTATILVNGTSDQTITSSVTAGRARLPNLTINKTAGNFIMSGVISVEGNWLFTAGGVLPQTSTVTLYNAAKTIDGEGTSTTMEFYNLTLGDASTRIMNGDVTVQNVLALNTGRFMMQSNTISLLNGATGALTVTTGGLYGENTGNFSKVSWAIGTNTGAHVIPFENIATFDIPFTFNLTAGNAGTVTVSTYPTAANNTPYPVTPQSVLNVNGVTGADNSANTVNRFWQIDHNGTNPTADLTFTYADNDWDVAEPSDYMAQRYNDPTDIWQPATTPQTANPLLNQVVVTGVTTFSPWTLARSGTPLEIQMTGYDLIVHTTDIDLYWSVLSETDILSYRVEKTIDFHSIEELETIYPGRSLYSFSDKNPTSGISYYRIVALLANGESEYFNWKEAKFENEEENHFILFPNPAEKGNIISIRSTVSFDKIELYNLEGQLINTESFPLTENFQYQVPINISQGCYIISAGNKKTKLFVSK